MIEINPTSYTLTPLPLNVKVGNFVSIGADVKFHSSGTHLAAVNHACVYTTNYDQTNDAKLITIGHDVWIGEGVRILDGITIGTGAIIGTGAVIAKDVPAYAVVVGNPQQITRIRFTPEQIAKLEKISWWWWSKEEVLQRLEEMKDIDTFLTKYETIQSTI